MCIGSAPKDNSAEIARQQEEARQARIRQGTEQVNQVFGKFDDDWYGGVQKASDEYYLPQVQGQYDDARRNLILELGRAGTLTGSVGARKLGDLDEAFQKSRAEYANQGVSAASQARADVERSKSEILGQLSASADPAAAAASANARALSLTAPPVFSPLGKLFADYATLGATGLAAERAGYRGFNTGLFNNPTSGRSSGSLRVVT